MPKADRSRRFDRILIPVFRHGQTADTKPSCLLTLRELQNWWEDGSGTFQGSGNGRRFILAKPLSDRLQLRTSLGVSLIYRYLRGDDEAVALVNSFRMAA